MQAYLKLDHIDKIFTRGNAATEVLKDINLTIEQGEFVSIIGHSGCGKSTLLNIVAGLPPSTPRGGLLENPRGDQPGPHPPGGVQKHPLLPLLTRYRNIALPGKKEVGAAKTPA